MAIGVRNQREFSPNARCHQHADTDHGTTRRKFCLGWPAFCTLHSRKFPTDSWQKKNSPSSTSSAQFVKMANRFQADIFVEKDGEEVDGKSIMGLMMLAAGHGSVITVSADGADADEALAALEDLISRKFEED
jgi:phosphocarrier protein